MEDILRIYFEHAFLTITNILKVYEQKFIWTFFLVLVNGTRARNLSIPSSYILLYFLFSSVSYCGPKREQCSKFLNVYRSLAEGATKEDNGTNCPSVWLYKLVEMLQLHRPSLVYFLVSSCSVSIIFPILQINCFEL
jgi:hypothetical protein